jgi:hypothetical protein
MSFKRFRDQDLVYTTLKTHPEYNFIINSGKVYLQKEKTKQGDLSSEALRHVPAGSISLYELNVDRDSSVGSAALTSGEMPNRDFAGEQLRPNTMSRSERDALGNASLIPISYPMSASLSRIYVPTDTTTTIVYSNADEDISNRLPVSQRRQVSAPSKNRKYVLALENALSNPDNLSSGSYENHKLAETNMICIPGIFYGSAVKEGSVSLDYYITGTMIAQAKDKFSNGKLICTVGPSGMINTQIGTFLYNQGLAVLTSSAPLGIMTDNYFSGSASERPSWINFGTGIKEAGDSGLKPGTCANSSYVVNFKGTNRIPTLTMYSYSEKGEHNFSNNPTFLENNLNGAEASLLGEYSLTTSSFTEPSKKIKKVNKSVYHDHEEDFVSTTYISKVGIYDEDKNLIAVATLANPVKKTEKRDFMIKMKIDF